MQLSNEALIKQLQVSMHVGIAHLYSENAMYVSVYRCLCVPSDQEYVEGYRLLVLSEPLPSIEKNSGTCNSELGDTQTIQTDVAFDSKVGVLAALLVGELALGSDTCIMDCHPALHR